MLGGCEPHLLQQHIVCLPQGIGQPLNARILYRCHLVDPQPHLFDLLSKRSHFASPALGSRRINRLWECDDSGQSSKCRPANGLSDTKAEAGTTAHSEGRAG